MEKIISLRYYLFRLYNEGYTQEQMQDLVKWGFEEGNWDIEELIEALVDSRFEELRTKKKLAKIEDAFHWF